LSSRSFGSRIDPRSGKADVGLGSFYNHFSTKSEPFEAAVADVLEELGGLFDRLSVDVEDGATAFAQSVGLMLLVDDAACDQLVEHDTHATNRLIDDRPGPVG
jgi:AcrR family transcriptional regulator